MTITSSAYHEGERIPAKFTCDGANIHPPVLINDVPEQAKSLALILNDPDSPQGTFTHWTLWNIRPEAQLIAEGLLPEGSAEGVTSFGNLGYGGPCPHEGTHRYVFTLYALSEMLDLESGASVEEFMQMIEGKVITTAEFLGTYSRVHPKQL